MVNLGLFEAHFELQMKCNTSYFFKTSLLAKKCVFWSFWVAFPKLTFTSLSMTVTAGRMVPSAGCSGVRPPLVAVGAVGFA